MQLKTQLVGNCVFCKERNEWFACSTICLVEGASHFPITKAPQTPVGSPKLANSTALMVLWFGHLTKAAGAGFSTTAWNLPPLDAHDLMLAG